MKQSHPPSLEASEAAAHFCLSVCSVQVWTAFPGSLPSSRAHCAPGERQQSEHVRPDSVGLAGENSKTLNQRSSGCRIPVLLPSQLHEFPKLTFSSYFTNSNNILLVSVCKDWRIKGVSSPAECVVHIAVVWAWLAVKVPITIHFTVVVQGKPRAKCISTIEPNKILFVDTKI